MVDDVGIGRLFRAIRLRLGWRQLDVSEKAQVSRALYSAIERGHLDRVPLGTLRRIAAVLEIRLPIEPSWRGGQIERVLSGRHAAMEERITAMLVAAGWEVRPEASFNNFGERGAKITIRRQDGELFAIESFTAKLLANTGGAGGPLRSCRN